ncbi:permease [Idiomarina sp. HP20-50]|uniref:permease n=1 Tax=Idiomarina sp. HP20-50 TaxID=3070813 RepID=UPI00294AF05D|nr:permease [Idiomarina sp. HP20-50]MDV6317360.1 permease [Idiomarina sp. HP20-50]
MENFISLWGESAYTSLGFFWMALWAFVLGYLISSLIQVLVTKQRMRKSMGGNDLKSVSLGTFFGFISSSCSFAALSTTRALFNKGAAFSASMAFMLASTNLVIELGFVIALFLGWQFVVGEYVGGLLLILFAWLFITLTNPQKLIKNARQEDEEDEHHRESTLSDLLSKDTWQQVGQKYVMEWQMVWKDVLIGFTVAGVISAFVPSAFFEWLFVGVGTEGDPGFWSLLQQAVVGPVAAFFTFIGSMGNIPLAAVLFGEGVAFAGVMAFIFSDLIVLPVIKINARYYGWKMALYITLMLFTCLVATSLAMHYGLLAFDLLPDVSQWSSPANQEHFKFDYGFVLNIIFLLFSAIMIFLWKQKQKEHEHHHHHDHGGSSSISDKVMTGLCGVSVLWLLAGMGAYLMGG